MNFSRHSIILIRSFLPLQTHTSRRYGLSLFSPNKLNQTLKDNAAYRNYRLFTTAKIAAKSSPGKPQVQKLSTPDETLKTLKASEIKDSFNTKQQEDSKELQTTVNAAVSSPFTVPNILTMTRIFSAPFVGYFIVSGEPNTALLIFAYSCITDFVDGFIARRFNMKSVLGSILDPAADKMLMGVCTVSLAYTNAIPGLVAAAIIGRDAMLSAMAFYYRYTSLESPRAGKFFNLVRYPTISVHPNMLGKVNTALQMVYIGGLVCKPWVEQTTGFLLESQFDNFGAIVAITTVASGVSYLRRRRIEYVK